MNWRQKSGLYQSLSSMIFVTPNSFVTPATTVADVQRAVAQAGTGEIVHGPDLDSHGLMDDPGSVLEKAAQAVVSALEGQIGRADLGELQKTVRQAVGRVVRGETQRKPVIFPVVIEL